MHSQFIARNPLLIAAQKHRAYYMVSIGEIRLCTARACTKRLDETEWSEMGRRDLLGRDRDETRDAVSRRDVKTEATFWTQCLSVCENAVYCK